MRNEHDCTPLQPNLGRSRKTRAQMLEFLGRSNHLLEFAMFVAVAGFVINLNHVAYLDENAGGDRTAVHMTIPIPEIPEGLSYLAGAAPPVGTGHVVLYVSKADGKVIREHANKK